MKNDNLLLKAILFVNVLRLIFSSVIALVIIIGLGVFFFNEKTLVVPDEFPTIQDAVDAAVPGDTILVKASGGPYEESVLITTEDINLIGIGKEKPVIDGDTVVGGGNGITIDNTSGVLVKNFIVQNFDSVRGIFLDSSNNNMIKENIVNNNELGIRLSDSNSNMIKGNTANDNSGFDGIFLSGSDNNMIKGNNFNGNNRFGIFLNFGTSSSSNLIKGNTANNNGNDGIFLDAAANNNNVFFNRAFGNGNGMTTFDINDQDANNFKGNKCGTSFGANVDCGN
ncbi:right-handed parallel beta-helix repeat-containing protein [Jeotgalibacillus marinus]|uniref:NosD domain-containing protein n=1 Tax=Jeotgalibacillus marinus TaxID=86667 RepID=A0ABV3Q606_9BACL